MSRYIDADEIKIPKMETRLDDTKMRCAIANTPTIDAVSVVRCKDCKHKHPYNNVWLCRFGLMMPGNDGYCSYGEKVSE